MKSGSITVQQLAKILFEEFERDYWGDIDPFLFSRVADGDPAAAGYTRDLVEVLDKVVARLNNL